MNFLLHDAQHESRETPNPLPTRGDAHAVLLRAPESVLIANQILDIAVSHSKQTTATCINRYFFGPFSSVSRARDPRTSWQPAASNRQTPQLETHLTHTKQDVATVSNRQKTHSCVSVIPERLAGDSQSILAPRTLRA